MRFFDHTGVGLGSSAVGFIFASFKFDPNMYGWMGFMGDLERLIAGALFIGISAITFYRKWKGK